MGHKTIDELVRADEGLVSRSIFVDDEIFQQELKQVFSRAWLFVGHESLVPKPDDYFVSRMGTESVILTRDRQGQIQVMLNSCAHRGMKLCRYDHGNNRTFTCPYHGWSFSTDGKLVERPGELVGVPGHATHYKGELDKKQWGLKTVAQVVNYKGAIWATWDPDAPPFLDYLGNMRLYLDAALDHRDGSPGGSEVIGGVQKWRVKCNWKFAPENFIGGPVPRHQPSLGGHRGHRARRGQGAARCLRQPFGDLFSGAGAWPAGPPAVLRGRAVRAAVRALSRGGSLFPPDSRAARTCAGFRHARADQRGHHLPEHVLSRAPAAHAGGVPSHQPDRDGNVAHVSGGQGCARGRQGCRAPLFPALFGAGRHDRIGRHGELDRRHRGQHGNHVARAVFQLPDGRGPCAGGAGDSGLCGERRIHGGETRGSTTGAGRSS